MTLLIRMGRKYFQLNLNFKDSDFMGERGRRLSGVDFDINFERKGKPDSQTDKQTPRTRTVIQKDNQTVS